MPDKVALAVMCAAASAFCYALSSVIQQHEAEQIADEETRFESGCWRSSRVGLDGLAEQVMQPLAGVALGVGLLDENVAAGGPLSRIVASLALAAIVCGVIALARIENPAAPSVVADEG